MTGEGTRAVVSLACLDMGIPGHLLEIDMSVYPSAQKYPACHAGGGARLLPHSGTGLLQARFSEVMAART